MEWLENEDKKQTFQWNYFLQVENLKVLNIEFEFHWWSVENQRVVAKQQKLENSGSVEVSKDLNCVEMQLMKEISLCKVIMIEILESMKFLDPSISWMKKKKNLMILMKLVKKVEIDKIFLPSIDLNEKNNEQINKIVSIDKIFLLMNEIK